jgi:Zn-dependent peptidase ImmA (M78 family)
MQNDKIAIEARRLQYEIWAYRDNLWPMGHPRFEQMFEPRVAARVCGLEYELADSLDLSSSKERSTAGVLNRDRLTIRISPSFSFEIQRFTGAHEIGHFVLHPYIGKGVVHRDRPIQSTALGRSHRDAAEAEADYFAACFLMSRKLLQTAFLARFGTKLPLTMTEAVLFSLNQKEINPFFSAPRGSILFAKAVATATTFDGRKFQSLASQFGVSPSAMAIRLVELGLVAD